jgi:hypothetical protein
VRMRTRTAVATVVLLGLFAAGCTAGQAVRPPSPASSNGTGPQTAVAANQVRGRIRDLGNLATAGDPPTVFKGVVLAVGNSSATSQTAFLFTSATVLVQTGRAPVRGVYPVNGAIESLDWSREHHLVVTYETSAGAPALAYPPLGVPKVATRIEVLDP